MAQKPENRIIPYGRQRISEDDISAVCDVLRSDFLTTGPKVEEFETAFAARVDAEHAIAVSSCTAALHVLYAALDIGPGDTIIVPAVTFLATANMAELLGARAVFADVSSETGLMTPATLAEAFDRAPGAKAVVAVHLNGQSCDMDGLADLCDERGVLLLEDAAHAVGTETRFRDQGVVRTGSCKRSVGACFSFHPVKTVAMGEGGAVTCNDDALAARIRLLRNHGMSRNRPAGSSAQSDGSLDPWLYFMESPGFNYRVTDIQCALGLSQLSRLDSFVAERDRISKRYDAAFSDIAHRARPIDRVSGATSGWHLYPLMCLGGSSERRALFHWLLRHGIRPQVHYIPLTHQPYYNQRIGSAAFPGADRYYESVISLPLFVGLTDGEQNHVVETVREFFSR